MTSHHWTRFISSNSMLAVVTFITSPAQAAEDSSAKAEQSRMTKMERVMVIGSPDRVDEIAGSAHIVDEEHLAKYEYKDVSRVLRSVPGVYVQEEDGYGSRPNIGMRGSRVDRSADISLLEDGVLIAPAPYSSPSAYYFPRVDRMESFEVRKGSSTIKYGPLTTNGALNMVTRSIPNSFEGEVAASYGSHNTSNLRADIGDTIATGNSGSVGYLLHYSHNESDGFKNIDFVNNDTGYKFDDFLGKVRFTTPSSARVHQEVEVKVGLYDELSDETYLGLTNADFDANPYRRYASSQLDEMDAQHEQLSVQHYIEPTESVDITTTLYRHHFFRNWYKLQSVTANGTTRGISSVLADQANSQAHIDVLRAFNTANDALNLRANRRAYESQGIQSVVGYNFAVGAVDNQLEVGLRYHEDEEDRYQWEDGYAIVNGQMVQTSAGAGGSNANRIGSADAWAGFVQNEMQYGRVTVTPGVRYEYIELERENYGSSDPFRTGASKTTFERTVTAVIPGVSAKLDVTDDVSIFAGVHKGFAPPSPPGNQSQADTIDEEESVNYEAGVRYGKDNVRAELVGFFNDYDNLLGRDTFSSGGTGAGDQFNGGEVEVMGIEAMAEVDVARYLTDKKNVRVPLRAVYTFTDTEFQNSFASSFGEWGTVQAGDELPYIPEHQLYLSAGVEQDSWGAEISGKYTAEMRTVAGSGDILPGEGTDESFIVDVTGYADLTEYRGTKTTAFARIDNLFDEEYIVSRRPAGARPGLPFTATAGLKVAF